MHRTKILFISLLLASGCGKEPAAPAPPVSKPAAARPAAPVAAASACPEKPNVLLISLDTLRFDATSLSANPTNRTRYLEQLAGVGVSFTRAYSTHDSTPYSHFSMLTGFINGYQTGADVKEVSLAHQLNRRGYRTWGVSANGNLSPKFTRSMQPFGSFVNLNEVWNELPADRKNGLLPAIDQHLGTYGHALNEWNRMMVFSMGPAVLRYVEPRLDGAQPFFGFINLLHSHDPYLPTAEGYDRAGENGVTVPDLRVRPVLPEVADPERIADPARRARVTEALARSPQGPLATTFDLTPEQLAVYKRRYHARVRELDAALGSILRELGERSLLESTILVVTSDHGEAFGERDLITHSFLNRGDLEATTHVPMLIVLPPCYRVAPRTVDARTSIADLPPTLYDLLGIDARPIWKKTEPDNIGRSLIRHLGKAATVAATPADTNAAKPLTEAERRREDDEALRRFKALGYLQ